MPVERPQVSALEQFIARLELTENDYLLAVAAQAHVTSDEQRVHAMRWLDRSRVTLATIIGEGLVSGDRSIATASITSLLRAQEGFGVVTVVAHEARSTL